jgi:hypothetical protein
MSLKFEILFFIFFTQKFKKKSKVKTYVKSKFYEKSQTFELSKVEIGISYSETLNFLQKLLLSRKLKQS